MQTTSESLEGYLQRHGDEIRRTLKAFAENSEAFAREEAHLGRSYANQWVAIHQGKITVVADTLDDLSQRIEAKGISLRDTMIRRIENEQTALIF